MNTVNEGYLSPKYPIATKRYYQTLELKDDPELIAEYVKRHSEEMHWREIREGIRSVGILEMEIYLSGTHLFMMVETPMDFNWDEAFAKLATLPKQSEWEAYMSIFQIARRGASSSEKWQRMKRIFNLYQ